MRAAQLETARGAILIGIVLVLGLLAWSYYATRRKVLDASNSAYLSGAFDALNPNVPGVYSGGVPTGGA